MPTIKDESRDDGLDFTKSMFKEGKVSLPDIAVDLAHRNGPTYTDRIKNKSIIVRFAIPTEDFFL